MSSKLCAVITAVVLAFILSPRLLPAVGFRSCKECSWDYYGQAICVVGGGPGQEGGLQCFSGLYCNNGECYEVCYTTQPCQWA